jgi:hypothetical protein
MNEKLMMVACAAVASMISVAMVYGLVKLTESRKPINRLLRPPVWWRESKREWRCYSMKAGHN